MPTAPFDPSDPRPREIAVALVAALLLHLLLIPLALWTDASRAGEASPTILVYLEPDPRPAPAPPPPEPSAEAPPPQPADEVPPPPERSREKQAPPDDSLLGWKTRGDEPGDAVRPPGPEADAFGLPEPGEGADEPDVEPEAAIPEGPRGEPVPQPQPSDSHVEPAAEATEPSAEASEPQAPPLGEGAASDRPPAEAPVQLRPPPASPPEADPAPLRDAPEARRPGPRPLHPDDYHVGGAFGDLQFESRDYNWSEYSSKVYWAVYRSWLDKLFLAAARGAFARDQSLGQLPALDGEVSIRFTLDRQGNVADLVVVEPSVVATLDQASSAAITGAILPPLPADFPRDSERVVFRFRIIGFPDERSLRLSLWQSKMAGRF